LISEIQRNLRHNMTVNLLDGAFFGFALGFASVVTILPLFVATMTTSPFLIGLIPAIHSVGWQLPQLFTAKWIGRQKHIKPLVVGLTVLERLPFLGLAAVAFLLPEIGAATGLALTFAMLVVLGLGAGLTANPWQSMIGKIIPGERRGTFFGLQAGAAYLLGSVGAVLAGMILDRSSGTDGFGYNFLLALAMLAISWVFVALTREPTSQITDSDSSAATSLSGSLRKILKCDHNFRGFLVARIFSQLSLMGYAFYSFYAVSYYGVSKVTIGWMTGVLMAANVLANVAMGWLGDRWGHRRIMEAGLVAMALGALLAWWAPAPGWFFLVFILAALGNVAIWTVGLSMTLEYGTETERPAYIGLANTLVAPVNILVPFLGAWLAQAFGYPTAFAASAAGGLCAAGIFHFVVEDQKFRLQPLPTYENPEPT
jgi:MFS family permease